MRYLFQLFDKREKISQTLLSSSDIERSFGLGDIMLLARYDLVQSNWQWSVTAGIKLASGKNDVLNNNGLRLVNDLQPGSKAVDYLFRTSLATSLKSRPSATIFSSLTYSRKGVNQNYLPSIPYKFGNEVFAILGIQDQWLIGSQIFNPGIAFRYRVAYQDQVNNSILASTGGRWFFTQLDFGWDINTKDNLALSFELPLRSFVHGTQLSPNFSINLSFYSKFKI